MAHTTATTARTTTTTIVMTAPSLRSPNDGFIWDVPHRPGSYFNPINIWKSTLPTSDRELFEWSTCTGCPFEVLEERIPGQTYNEGLAEVALPVEQVTGDYQWRVTAVYADGTTLTSATWGFSVYAFDEVNVSGTVTDKTSGTPLSSVHLILASGPAHWARNTGPSGTFNFNGGPGGPQTPTLTVSKSGYETQTIELAIGESAVVDIELTPTP